MTRARTGSGVCLSLENGCILGQSKPADVVRDSHRVETLLLSTPQIQLLRRKSGILYQIIGGDASDRVDLVDI